jgi:antitoxin (DNA-binding transcriptional repressor) of toxin-antitoxin stability system
MRRVSIDALTKELDKYLELAKNGEKVMICYRGRPITRLVPFTAEDATEEELELVAEGKMRLPKIKIGIEDILKIPTARVKGNKAVAALLADRESR